MQITPRQILKLTPTRVWRTYRGGAELERWQGASDPADGDRPEAWIASTVRARNPGREHIQDEGLSRVITEECQAPLLADLIRDDPIGYLGTEHVRRFGPEMGVLSKIIDSCERLTLQVHPDRRFAKEVLHSEYGKTEAWYILGGRAVNGETPCVYFGFRPGITQARWRDLFVRQDIPGMLNALHKIPVQAGDVFLIEGGVPHAIGAGCLLLEVQEPTDFTFRTERTTPSGAVIDDRLIHQGAGFDRLFDCFHYDGLSEEQTLRRWRIPSRHIPLADGATETILIGQEQTRLFGMKKLTVPRTCRQDKPARFCSIVISTGEGIINCGDRSMTVRQGDFLFAPAAAASLCWQSTGNTPLQILICEPPAE